MKLVAGVPLAAHTSLAVGGPAAHFCEARDASEVHCALSWANERACAVVVVGGGSNLVVADRGLEALVLRVRQGGIDAHEHDGELKVSVGAGVTWDELVAFTVARGFAGIECLSGIPGEVGAAPLQNIGAYGQEVASVIERVQVIDRQDGRELELAREQCAFGYRDSLFKAAERFVVLRVDFRFHAGPPSIVYPELARAFDGREPTLGSVRQQVLSLRRSKSMLLDPSDPNGKSAGSFFVNPTVSHAVADEVAARAHTIAPGHSMPRFEQPTGVKLSAAWLIEQSGLAKGTARGRVGLSTRHCLSIVNRGEASASEIIAFASEVRARVRDRFGVSLTPEPRCYGFRPGELAGLFE
jgi:UDP-N-acetylmuramate dehydrogenase